MFAYPLPSTPTHFQRILVENLTNPIGISPKTNFQKTIKIEQLGLRRSLWGHSFKSSYALELILDLGETYIFFLLFTYFF